MKKIIFYISGHGFGHSSRMAEVIRVLLKSHPDINVIIKTSAPKWFFQEHIPYLFEFYNRECDTGVVQADSLNLAPLQTLKKYAAFSRQSWKLVQAELDFIRRIRPDLIVGDIPPLAFEIAARASIPSLAIANFSWDWIYEPYVEEYPEYLDLLSAIREGYRQAALLLRLPFFGPMPAFRKVQDVPLITRKSERSAEEIRGLLALPQNKPVVLLSFGGFWLGEEYYLRLTKIQECVWIASERVGKSLPGVRNFDRQAMKKVGLTYPDLVKAADAVVTKPGYGILSECIANRTKMLYTSRGNFQEYSILVGEAQKFLPSRFISQEKLKSGDLKEELFELLRTGNNFPSLPLHGAEICSRILLNHAGLN